MLIKWVVEGSIIWLLKDSKNSSKEMYGSTMSNNKLKMTSKN